jgi:urease accessory protein
MRRFVSTALRTVAPALLSVGAAAAAHAHDTGTIGVRAGFAPGFSHPLHGLDHILAMVAVGLWAAQTGGKATWAIPLTFVGVMALGGAWGMAGGALPLPEMGITLSVLLLGVLIAAAARPKLWVGMLLVGLFALFHGHAHGAEMPAAVSSLNYAAGFISATLLLHAAGIATAIAAQKGVEAAATPQAKLLRFAGAAIALCGGYLTFSTFA